MAFCHEKVTTSSLFQSRSCAKAADVASQIVRPSRSSAIQSAFGAHDVGRVLNRLGIEGQVEGGIVMGQGYALTEEMLIEEGVLKNPAFRDYKLVTAPEIPDMDVHFIETMDGEGPKGAKGVGEAPAICIAAAVANAIENATGVRIRELPFTPERVYRALRAAESAGHQHPEFPQRGPANDQVCAQQEPLYSLP